MLGAWGGAELFGGDDNRLPTDLVVDHLEAQVALCLDCDREIANRGVAQPLPDAERVEVRVELRHIAGGQAHPATAHRTAPRPSGWRLRDGDRPHVERGAAAEMRAGKDESPYGHGITQAHPPTECRCPLGTVTHASSKRAYPNRTVQNTRSSLAAHHRLRESTHLGGGTGWQ